MQIIAAEFGDLSFAYFENRQSIGGQL